MTHIVSFCRKRSSRPVSILSFIHCKRHLMVPERGGQGFRMMNSEKIEEY